MSNLTKSLQTRIHELTASIDAQKTELAAYQNFLQIETAKAGTSIEQSPSDTPSKTNPSSPQGTSVAPPVDLADITTKGNKTTLVADIVRAHGKLGASPKEVDQFFSARKIKRGKNLIYNTLSYLVAQKKRRRLDGRYFGAATAPVVQSQSAAPPTKMRLSPAGLTRIREGVKKHWAAKRAADKAAAK
jgi:hypothetical protein